MGSNAGSKLIVVTKQRSGKKLVIKLKSRKSKCSTPRQLCLHCKVVIHKNDKRHETKVCRKCEGLPSLADERPSMAAREDTPVTVVTSDLRPWGDGFLQARQRRKLEHTANEILNAKKRRGRRVRMKDLIKKLETQS